MLMRFQRHQAWLGGRVAAPVSIGLVGAALLAGCGDGRDDLAESSSKNLGLAASGATVPVFEVVSEGMTAADARRLADVLGIDAPILGADGAARFVDDERFQHTPMRRVVAQSRPSTDESGKPTAASNEAFDWDALARRDVLSLETAIAHARGALAAADLAVGGIPRAGHSVLESWREGGETQRANLDTRVSWDLELSGRRLVGPGARVTMTFDPDGRVTHLVLATRTLVEGDAVAIVSPSEARALCATAFGLAGVEVLEPELVYYAPPLTERVTQIAPHYACNGRAPTPDGWVELRTTLVAAMKGSVADTRGKKAVASGVGRTSTGGTFAPPVVGGLGGEPHPLPPADGGGSGGGTGSSASPPAGSVGTEWLGVCGGLSAANGPGFATRFAQAGLPATFNWGEGDAWAADFRDPIFGGQDTWWTDAVDMVFYTGHANESGFAFCSDTDGWMDWSQARWGNGNLEWLVIAACGPLQGSDWASRWGSSFQSLHLLLGYASTSWDSSYEGQKIANYMIRSVSPLKVRQAWSTTAIEEQPTGATWAVGGPCGSGGTTPNYNDYYWNKGATGADVPAPTGFWKVSGPT